MKIEELTDHLQTNLKQQKLQAYGEILPSKPKQAESKQPKPNLKGADREQDIVVVSDEPILWFAVSRFGPHRITTKDATKLLDFLHAGGAITGRDHAILKQGLSSDSSYGGSSYGPRNVVTDFQDRLTRQLGGRDVIGVEHSSRALNILVRIDGVRSGVL